MRKAFKVQMVWAHKSSKTLIIKKFLLYIVLIVIFNTNWEIYLKIVISFFFFHFAILRFIFNLYNVSYVLIFGRIHENYVFMAFLSPKVTDFLEKK